eukprot:8252175-Pyramimonas_sp.AAC.1
MGTYSPGGLQVRTPYLSGHSPTGVPCKIYKKVYLLNARCGEQVASTHAMQQKTVIRAQSDDTATTTKRESTC